MHVKVYCNKCGETGTLDIGDMSKEKVIDALTKQDSFHCFGNHVEISSPIKYWEINWSTLHEAKTPTEEEFVDTLKKQNSEVYSLDELQQRYTILGFVMGMCKAETKDTHVTKMFDFTTSPSGKRYYMA